MHHKSSRNGILLYTIGHAAGTPPARFRHNRAWSMPAACLRRAGEAFGSRWVDLSHMVMLLCHNTTSRNIAQGFWEGRYSEHPYTPPLKKNPSN